MKRRLLFVEEQNNKYRKLTDENPIQNQLIALPKDAYIEIFNHCHIKDLIRLGRVSKQMSNIVKSSDQFKMIVDINKQIENLQPSELSAFIADHLKTSAVATLMSISATVGAYTSGNIYGGLYGAAAFALYGGYATLVTGIGLFSTDFNTSRSTFKYAAIGTTIALSLPAFHIINNIGISTGIVGLSTCGLSLFGLLSHTKKINKDLNKIKQIESVARLSISSRE